MKSVIQEWVCALPMMQQTVLLTAIRGPDGLPKYGPVKMLLRWYRRCLLLSAMDGAVLSTPYHKGGGSFTGPSLIGGSEDWERTEVDHGEIWWSEMDLLIGSYLRELDALPHHFQMHFLHAVEIMGYKHPVPNTRSWWRGMYARLVNDMHLAVETEEQLDRRLGDSREGWLARADPATVE